MKFSVKVVLFVAALAAFASARVAPLDSALRSATSKENSSVKVFDSRSAAEVRPIKPTTIRALSVSPGNIVTGDTEGTLWLSMLT